MGVGLPECVRVAVESVGKKAAGRDQRPREGEGKRLRAMARSGNMPCVDAFFRCQSERASGLLRNFDASLDLFRWRWLFNSGDAVFGPHLLKMAGHGIDKSIDKTQLTARCPF